MFENLSANAHLSIVEYFDRKKPFTPILPCF